MFIAVEGNMGAGKTTLIQELVRLLGAELLPEPVDSPTFAALLERYYEAPRRWGLSFQLDTIRARVVAQRETEASVSLQDRSVIGDAIFAEVAYRQGFMDDTEYAVYDSLRQALTHDLPAPDLVLYLRAEPETCHERIGLRARSCEHGVPLDYLRALHEAHERMAERHAERLLLLPWEEFRSPREVAREVSLLLGLPALEPAASARSRSAPRRRAGAPANELG